MSIAESLGFQVAAPVRNHKDKYLNTEEELKDRTAEEQKELKSKTLSLVDDIPYILKTAALLHDMGNPPYRRGLLGFKYVQNLR